MATETKENGSENGGGELLAEPHAFYEADLQNAWNNLAVGKEFRDNNGCSVMVHSPGIWNVESGPDFLNARVTVNGVKLTGAVEIHCRAGDWFRHGHHQNPAYDTVILHVAGEDDFNGSEQKSSLPPLFILPPRRRYLRREDLPKIKQGRCVLYFAALGQEKLQAMLVDAGRERFFRKSNDILRRMLLFGIENTCLQLLFEGVGYKYNRQAFLELCRRWQEYPEKLREEEFAAIIWGESELLPDPSVTCLSGEMRDFVDAIWRRWWKLRLTARTPLPWRRLGRPANRPERRVAAAVALIAAFGCRPLSKMAENVRNCKNGEGSGKALIDALIMHDRCWDRRTDFVSSRAGAAAILGRSTAIELAANVILPALYAAAGVDRGDRFAGLHHLALETWEKLPDSQDNRILHQAVSRWFGEKIKASQVFKGAAARQGAIHLFREYCEKCQSDCLSCLLYNSI